MLLTARSRYMSPFAGIITKAVKGCAPEWPYCHDGSHGLERSIDLFWLEFCDYPGVGRFGLQAW